MDTMIDTLLIENQEAKPKFTKEQIEAIWQADAELGRKYSPEFLHSLLDTCIDVCCDWTRLNAPADFGDLFQSTIVLQMRVAALEAGKLNDMEAADLARTLPELTELVMRFGGKFISTSREFVR